MRIGFILMLVGIVYLYKNLGYISAPAFSVIWPIILILIGIAFVGRYRCSYHGIGCEGRHDHGDHKGNCCGESNHE